MRKYLGALAFGVLAGAMLVYPLEAAQAAWDAIALWGQAVAPVLGPFMVCMLMLASRLGGGMGISVGLSWLCGSPGGAKIMGVTGVKGQEALSFAAMTGTMSPMFFLGTVSQWLGGRWAGALALFAHLSGAFALGMLLPGNAGKKKRRPQPMPLMKALQESAQALLSIALCMMLGCVSARMTLCAFPGLSPLGAALLQCLLEVTAGAKAAAELEISCKGALVCAACSLGGLSLLLQNGAIWQEQGVGMGRLALIRIAHAMISFGIYGGISRLFSL